MADIDSGNQVFDEFAVHCTAKHLSAIQSVRLTIRDFGLVINSQSKDGQFLNKIISSERLIQCNLRGSLTEESSSSTVVLKYFEEETQNKKHCDHGIILQKQKLYFNFDKVASAKQFFRKFRELFQRNASQKPYLFFLNPRSGSHKALKIFQHHVEPTLLRLNIPFTVIQTQYPGDAEQWIETRSDAELAGYRALITVSGDGLLHEVVNGLANRPQSSGLQIPIGCLPAGGGNATPAAVCYNSGLSYTQNCLEHSLFTLTLPMSVKTSKSLDGTLPPSLTNNGYWRQRLTPMDGVRFESLDRRVKRVGVLSVLWGEVAELDIRSERFRWMGSARFDVSGLFSLARRRFRPVVIRYLPASTEVNPWCPGPVSAQDSSSSTFSTSNSTYSSMDRLLPEPDQPIPDHWEKIEGNFWSVMIFNHSHITSKVILLPKVKFNDGVLWMILINENLNLRSQIGLTVTMNADHGLRNTDYLQIIPILAARVEPIQPVKSFTLLDGELMDCQAFQAEIQRSRFQILTCERSTLPQV